MIVVGADGCRGGWVAVELRDGGFHAARFFERFEALLEASATTAVIGVDIPIGLLERGVRGADREARRALGPAASSLFATPPRAALEAASYAAAREVARGLGGPGISAQAYGLRAKILEVDPLAAADARIHEVHPELSFRALAGEALGAGKKSWNGLFERRRLLAAAGIALPEALGEAGRRAGADDVVDAGAAAWSAWRIARGEARCLPDPPETVPRARPIAIWT